MRELYAQSSKSELHINVMRELCGYSVNSEACSKAMRMIPDDSNRAESCSDVKRELCPDSINPENCSEAIRELPDHSVKSESCSNAMREQYVLSNHSGASSNGMVHAGKGCSSDGPLHCVNVWKNCYHNDSSQEKAGLVTLPVTRFNSANVENACSNAAKAVVNPSVKTEAAETLEAETINSVWLKLRFFLG